MQKRGTVCSTSQRRGFDFGLIGFSEKKNGTLEVKKIRTEAPPFRLLSRPE